MYVQPHLPSSGKMHSYVGLSKRLGSGGAPENKQKGKQRWFRAHSGSGFLCEHSEKLADSDAAVFISWSGDLFHHQPGGVDGRFSEWVGSSMRCFSNKTGRESLSSSFETFSFSVDKVQCSSGQTSCKGVHRSVVAQIWEPLCRANGSLRILGECPLPPVLLHNRSLCSTGVGWPITLMYACPPVVPPNFASSGQGAPTVPVPDPDNPLVAQDVMVCGDSESAGSGVLESYPLKGPAVSGSRGGGSSTSRTVESSCLPVERSNPMAKSLPPMWLQQFKVLGPRPI
ncbi:hypothetical protein Q8A73_020104 [Channa argus]|nr:hypothetical protein Q8A73_020104 [Channa argus]